MIKELHIFDMDGVLVDSSHRYRTRYCEESDTVKIDLTFWKEYEFLYKFDKLLPHAELYQQLLLDPSSYVIISTSRTRDPVDWYDFLCQKLGVPDQLFWRPANSTKRAFDLKYGPIRRLLNLTSFANLDSIHVYEDNAENCCILAERLNAIPHFVPSNQGH